MLCVLEVNVEFIRVKVPVLFEGILVGESVNDLWMYHYLLIYGADLIKKLWDFIDLLVFALEA